MSSGFDHFLENFCLYNLPSATRTHSVLYNITHLREFEWDALILNHKGEKSKMKTQHCRKLEFIPVGGLCNSGAVEMIHTRRGQWDINQSGTTRGD